MFTSPAVQDTVERRNMKANTMESTVTGMAPVSEKIRRAEAIMKNP